MSAFDSKNQPRYLKLGVPTKRSSSAREMRVKKRVDRINEVKNEVFIK